MIIMPKNLMRQSINKYDLTFYLIKDILYHLYIIKCVQNYEKSIIIL